MSALHSTIARHYEQMLVQLHHLILERRDESDAGEKLREEMDIAWVSLTPLEQARLAGLSADLYMAGQGEVPESVPDGYTRQHLASDLLAAWNANDADRILGLLRKDLRIFPPYYIAYVRAQRYAQLGFRQAGIAFMEHAAKLAPTGNYRSLLLEMLRADGRVDQAVTEANAAIAAPNSPPGLVVMAAGILFGATKQMVDASAHDIYKMIIERLQPLALGSGKTKMTPAVEMSGLVYFGLCHEFLGQSEQAQRAYDTALKLDPQNQVALLAKVLLAEQQNNQQTLDLIAQSQFRENRFKLAEMAIPFSQAA